ncbi:MAG TPA: RNA polymerase sigma factor [Gemmatimonadaceae bacterium]
MANAAAGDRVAFERLYRQHVNRVFSLCARMVNDHSRAEELVQDVFVRAWEKLHLFRGDSSFSTWLHRLTVNVVLNARKSDGRQRTRFEETDEEAGGMDALPGVVGSPLAPGDMLDLEEAITRLPPGARRVFVLHDVEGYKHEEIAEMLGVTTGATKAQLHRARMLLRESLNR